MKIKKSVKYVLYTAAGICVLIFLCLVLYYLFFFRNSNPLSFFVPDRPDYFISVHRPDRALEMIQTYLPEQAREELFSGDSPVSSGFLSFLLGKEAVFFSENGSWGIAAKISFPAKLALMFPGLITDSDVSEISLRGNRVLEIRINTAVYYLCSRWNILSFTQSRDIAARAAELLNSRPVIPPLALNRDIRKLVSLKGDVSEVYFSHKGFLADTPLQSELKDLSEGGGQFSISSDAVRSVLRLKGLPGQPEHSLRLPEYSRAFLTASFPCDINAIWLDYCYRVQARDTAYGSFTVTLTSEIFDSFIKSLKPAVAVYGFGTGKPGLNPSGVICFEAQEEPSEENLVILFREFIRKAQALNRARVKRSRVQSVTYTLKTAEHSGTTVYYIDIVPLAVPNFIPGFCVKGKRIFVATDSRELDHLLDHCAQKAKPVPQGIYVRITDPGLSHIFRYTEWLLNDPSRKRRMGEASFARAMDRLSRVKRWFGTIGQCTVEEKNIQGEYRMLELEILPSS